MALPDYFARNAVAAAQAISGLDEQRLAEQLADTVVGLSIGQSLETPEVYSAAELFIRLVARLYPRISLRATRRSSRLNDLAELATRINPRIELGGEPTVEVILGEQRLKKTSAKRIFTGSSGWQAAISSSQPLSCGSTENPFGPGLAACLSAANVFRATFLPQGALDKDATFSALPGGEHLLDTRDLKGSLGQVVLIGAGAIGNAAAWALCRLPMPGKLLVVDHERIDLGNLQRYVMAERAHERAEKAPLIASFFRGAVQSEGVVADLAGFLEGNGYEHEKMLLALDSAKDRRAAQASLPKWIANAWTQPGDLGVSVHDFAQGACVSCLYLPAETLRNEDEIIADALGIPDQIRHIRDLLYRGEGVSRSLLDSIASSRGIEVERLLPFEGKSPRALYTEGFCGGAVIPLGQLGRPRPEVHVPLVHQSAMAGVLLAAAAARKALGGATGSQVTQLDVLKPVPAFATRPAAKEPTGKCICHDTDYRRAFEHKYANATPSRARIAKREGRRTSNAVSG